MAIKLRVSLAALVLGLVLSTEAGEAVGPVVPEGYTVEPFATVTDPVHLSFDSDGNLFVGRDDSGSGGGFADPVSIHRVSADGNTVTVFGSPVPDPDGVVVDTNGSVAPAGPNSVLVGGTVGGPTRGRITQIAPSQVNSVLFESTTAELHNPQQLAVDSNGRVLLANCADSGAVGIIDEGGLAVFASGLGQCVGGIAVDPNDRIFVSVNFEGRVKLLDSAGNVLNSAFATGLSSPDALAFDTLGLFGGNLYVAERQAGNVIKVNPVTGATETFASGFNGVDGLAFGPTGSLFVSEFSSDTVWRIDGNPAALPALSLLGLLAMVGMIVAALTLRRRRPGSMEERSQGTVSA